MTDETRKKPSEEELRIRSMTAFLLWAEDVGEDIPEDAKARREAFAEHKSDYKKKASRLIRKLQARGVSLNLAEENA